MIRNVLTHIRGVELYGVLTICLFFACFLGLLVWTFCLKKSHLKRMGALPLDEEPSSSATEPRLTADSDHE